jgi:alkylation response protein AidB-like acyl-CoA dehydrogenase
MDQPGVELRPIEQITGTAEFNETFFSDARTSADLIVGEENKGWQVVMGTLGFERGTAFLAEEMRWHGELENLVAYAKRRGLTDDPVLRNRLVDAYIGLRLVKLNGMRTLSSLIKGAPLGPEASVGKLHWSSWHRDLGELNMDVMGAEGLIEHDGDEIGDFQYSFLWSRAETIFAGSNEIQRNIVAERVLGLPR